MKSSPNLTQPEDDGEGVVEGQRAHLPTGSSRDKPHMTSTKSTPNIPEEYTSSSLWQQREMGGAGAPASSSSSSSSSGGMPRSVSASGYGLSGAGNAHRTSGPGEGKLYSADMYTSDMNPNRKGGRRSMPAHNLLRYQPDYENVSHLGTAPLRSEKISEIDDIDEVTGRDSLPQSPDPKPYDPKPYDPALSSSSAGGQGVPTRDPASVKYIKVNQNHEKYPSWPVTKANGASDPTQSINSRAQSMTDNTNTSKEFPKKQRLAYTPGLRPLAEKSSPTAERRGEDGKARNSSDPGFKSEFVYDRFGRVQRRNYENVDNRFEDFYLNSKPGYPPPKMDSDGHNIEDKDYNAPSPPERDSAGVDQQSLNVALGNVGLQGQRSIGGVGEVVGGAGSRPRPTNLNLPSSVRGSSPVLVDSGTSPLDSGSPGRRDVSRPGLSGLSSQGRPYSGSGGDATSHGAWAGKRLADPSTSGHSPGHGGQSMRSGAVPGGGVQRDTPSSYQERGNSLPARPSPQSEGVSGISKDRPGSMPAAASSPGDRGGSERGDRGKAYVVKSTPYYNTSTQTDNMLPYAVKMSEPYSSVSGRHRNVETQVGEFATQTSPVSPADHKKQFGDKSVQARMSRDFQNSDLDLGPDRKPSPGDMGGVKKPEHFQYPGLSGLPGLSHLQTSPFPGIESIQAKYATDEPSDDANGDSNNSSSSNFVTNSNITTTNLITTTTTTTSPTSTTVTSLSTPRAPLVLWTTATLHSNLCTTPLCNITACRPSLACSPRSNKSSHPSPPPPAPPTALRHPAARTPSTATLPPLSQPGHPTLRCS
ncbi:uncharacterized protein LOC106013355 [Aplysia californica]|uniref:Uncharacterized protein LOC106013355 n=1 Tax=Aplysia californica TaxID=6500 RepID=A0ABM1AB33_APLCA|nr:uncharacterized protein LOC106013355 [Aplysia californica]